MIKNNKGQSTIEFILTFTVAVGFIFLFLKMALNYTNGYMVHHATYLASRAYLSSDAEKQTVEEGDKSALTLAKDVFTKNLPDALMPGVATSLKSNDPQDGRLSVFTGLYVDFTQVFSIGMVGGRDVMNFRSESFLGREPTRAESISQVCNAIKTVAFGSCDIQATLDDNGG